MSDQTESTSESGNAKSDRIAHLREELAALEAEQIDVVEEAVEEAAEKVDEAVEGAAKEVVEAIEEETGETLSPEDIRILKGIIAGKVAEEAAPEVTIAVADETDVAEAVVKDHDDGPDSAPVRTHILDRKIW